MEGNNICFIDFETTGVSLIDDYPIEIGAILISADYIIIEEFHSFIKPNNNYRIKDSALKVHGILDEQILNSPSEKEVLSEFFKKLGTNYRIAAWNMSFDVAFFKLLCQRNGFVSNLSKINYRHIDVQTISFVAKKLGRIPERLNSLSDVVSYFNLTRSNKHSAIEDARLLFQVYEKLFIKLDQ